MTYYMTMGVDVFVLWYQPVSGKDHKTLFDVVVVCCCCCLSTLTHEYTLCRSPVLRWRSVSPGVLDSATEAVASVPWAGAGRLWQAGIIRCTRMSFFPIQQVRQQRRPFGGGRCSHSRGTGESAPESKFIIRRQPAQRVINIVLPVMYKAQFCLCVKLFLLPMLLVFTSYPYRHAVAFPQVFARSH